jgi:hypothetical protein
VAVRRTIRRLAHVDREALTARLLNSSTAAETRLAIEESLPTSE